MRKELLDIEEDLTDLNLSDDEPYFEPLKMKKQKSTPMP